VVGVWAAASLSPSLSIKEHRLESAIGQHFETASSRRGIALAVGIAVVVTDFVICTLPIGPDVRLSLALIAFAVYVYLSDGDLRSLGLRPNPIQGWVPWIGISAKIAIAIAACLIVGLGTWRLLGNKLPIYNHDPAIVPYLFLHMCVVSPVLEEFLYRVVVCLALVKTVGCWRTIAINGILFASLHFVYGNPSPDNLVGGFFFAWMYLKSETILLPLMFHSVGNMVALGCQLASGYLHLNG
jgi:membrane protease YdiL (CAAX protease family)